MLPSSSCRTMGFVVADKTSERGASAPRAARLRGLTPPRSDVLSVRANAARSVPSIKTTRLVGGERERRRMRRLLIPLVAAAVGCQAYSLDRRTDAQRSTPPGLTLPSRDRQGAGEPTPLPDGRGPDVAVPDAAGIVPCTAVAVGEPGPVGGAGPPKVLPPLKKVEE